MSADKTVVCFGDSLTEGAIGASYVDILRQRLPSSVRIVNAGVNGDTTLNLLRRYERDVARRRPDVVVVLVGLNDLGTTTRDPFQRQYYRAFKGIWGQISPRRYAQLYRRLIHLLRERTGAQLALCTLTALGERADDPLQSYVDAYSAVVRALAWQEGLPVIDLRAAFHAAMLERPGSGPSYRIWAPLADAAAIAWRGQSYAALAHRRGYRLLCDGVHLADGGAELVAETMLPFLQRSLGVAPDQVSKR